MKNSSFTSARPRGGTSRLLGLFYGQCSLALLSSVLLLVAMPASGQQPHPQLAVHGNPEQLVVHAENVPLSDVLQRIARATGLQIVGADKLSGTVTTSFSGVPLREAVSRLLVEWDYALTEGDSSSVSVRRPRLFILERAAGAPPVSSAASARILSSPPGTSSQAHPKGEEVDPEAVVTPEESKRIAELHAAVAKHDVATLQAAIADPDPEIQRAAFDLLNGLEPATAISALVSASQNSDSTIVIQSLTLLVQSDGDRQVVLSALAAQLQNQDTSIKLYAVQALADIGSDAVDFLRQALTDPDRTVRLAVVQNAARGDWGLPLLQSALSDSDQQIQQMAQRLIEQLTPQDAPQGASQGSTDQ
jgi:hypothetical protein